ncbi:hypothetical protein OG741_14480 [Streptomyces sp. NBC_01410]|uniref:hypothetical protein n=1 Tax=Streptomyces sp. NBC_01410 TaxID=2903856 RepID=UPI00324528F1
MGREPAARLLPWTGPEGKPCYLLTDKGGGYISRVADQIESVQLGMGAELLGHAEAIIDDPRVDAFQLRFLSARLTEALRDAMRVAESRGARLPEPDTDPSSGA